MKKKVLSVFPGSRDLSGPRNESFGHDLDLDLDPRTRASQLLSPLTSENQQQQHPLLLPEDEETVFDSRGQRTRRRFADDFANEVAATTRRFKARMAAMELDQDVDAALNKKVEDVESSLKMRRSKLLSDELDEHQQRSKQQQASTLTRWSKLINDEEDDSMLLSGGAATRARQTKARLDDLESEMEELAERQAKRERRAAALRALVNETMSSSPPLSSSTLLDEQQRSSAISSKKISVRNERAEKHVSF